ncbi:hypothetical protein MAPG_08058 [Magnaporthiopsis poae ATCC 64411]|uniref:BRCT domain-containing protein n=1 Tax=Magnaporthiopsis poae (strain ATCC 64411 / 73-15) TaxID=644358 RepID=A0A0C4E6C4_MAGP6|nr:hypothetical protein MAPG_08058 [Magnaporthiopsis poae ATCC 64411]
MARRTATTKVKQIFLGLKIAIAGDLGWPDEKIKAWITLRGGEMVPDIDESTTHLKALRLGKGKKGCRVVHKDWLEYCCQEGKLLREGQYLLRHNMRAEEAIARETKKMEKGRELEECGRFVNEAMYRVYTDETGFQCKASISRDDEANGILGERFDLTLFESRAKPHLYWFAAKHYKKKGSSRTSYYRPSSSCQTYQHELALFKSFFLNKTGVRWEDRASPTCAEEGCFRYIHPTRSLPVGVGIETAGVEDAGCTASTCAPSIGDTGASENSEAVEEEVPVQLD